MKYQFQNPEVLLSQINRRLLTLRGATDAYLGNKKLSESLTHVIRKLLIAEILNDRYLIAVAGVQGAGKTTFLQSLYQLDNAWIEGNEGRGEKSPLLILECSGITTPEGWLQELTPDASGCIVKTSRKVSPEEFRNALKGDLPNQVVPELHVPQRYFGGDGRGFILLPGYEATRIADDIWKWQDLMRQSLVGSSLCIVVTNESRLAQDQRQILRDMHSHYLEGANPLFVVSNTENKSEESRTELLRTAAEVFQVSENDIARRVFCTGTDAFIEEWRPKFVEQLKQFSGVASTVRTRQLKHLHGLLKNELSDVLNDIKHSLREISIPGEEVKDYEAILNVFDESKNKLRKTYAKQLMEALNGFADDAAKNAVDNYIDSEEGFKNWLKNMWRLCQTSSGERERMQAARINNAWRGSSGKGFFLNHVDVMGKITRNKLGLPSEPAPLTATDKRDQRLLGYGTENQPASPKYVNAETQKNLEALFYPNRDGTLSLNKEAENTVKILPALGLEFARIANIIPETVGVDRESLQRTDMKIALGNIEKDFSFLSKTQSDVIKAIAMMLAIDGAADGKIDTIPALVNAFTTTSASTAAGTAAAAGGSSAAGGGAVAGGAAATVAVAAAAVVAVGILTVAVTREVQRQDAEQRDLCRRIIYTIRDKHFEHYMSSFDDLMDTIRDTLDARLRVRYHLDEKLMRHDRVAKPRADVESLKADMLEAIGGSPFNVLA